MKVMNSKHYAIYVQEKCIYDHLSEEDFHQTWDMLNHVVELIGNYRKDDLSFQELSS